MKSLRATVSGVAMGTSGSLEGKFWMNKQAYDTHECFLLIILDVILHCLTHFLWWIFQDEMSCDQVCSICFLVAFSSMNILWWNKFVPPLVPFASSLHFLHWIFRDETSFNEVCSMACFICFNAAFFSLNT